MENIYYIGGSPCSGKSTIAEILSKRYNLYYFKVDDFLESYTKLGVLKGYPICKKISELSAEQIWMRDPMVQCVEEFEWYKEVFEYVSTDLKRIDCKKGIITEGAAFVPNLIKQLGVPENRYVSITPTPEFQVAHYRKREYIPYVLEGCSDKEKAFSNWMDRDILFAKEVRKQCLEEGYTSIINDGNSSIDKLVKIVSAHFGL